MARTEDEKVDENKLRAFQDKVYQMAREEFGTDDEGKSNNVTVFCLDRTRYWPMHWFPVPYDFDPLPPEEEERVLEARLTNLSLATEEITRHLKMREFHKRLYKGKVDEKARRPEV